MKVTKFRFWDKDLKAMYYRKPDYNDFTHPQITPLQFTGFKDKFCLEIYEGDILCEWVTTDECVKECKMQVFWNDKTGSWQLDNSYKQDKTYSVELWLELNDYNYEIVGNIYENPLKS